MAAITVTALKPKMNIDGTRVSREVTLGSGSTNDTIVIRTKLGLRRINRVWLDVTAAFGTAPILTSTATTTANTVAGVYRFEGA